MWDKIERHCMAAGRPSVLFWNALVLSPSVLLASFFWSSRRKGVCTYQPGLPVPLPGPIRARCCWALPLHSIALCCTRIPSHHIQPHGWLCGWDGHHHGGDDEEGSDNRFRVTVMVTVTEQAPSPPPRRCKSQHRPSPFALALALALGTGKPAITEFTGPWALTGHHSRRNPAAGAGAGADHVGVRACGWAGAPRCSSVPMMVVAAVVVVVVAVVVVLYTAAAKADIYEDGTAGRTARKQCSGMERWFGGRTMRGTVGRWEERWRAIGRRNGRWWGEPATGGPTTPHPIMAMLLSGCPRNLVVPVIRYH